MLIEIFINIKQLRIAKPKLKRQNRSRQRSRNTMWAKPEKLQGSRRMKFATLLNSIKFQQGASLGNDKIRSPIDHISLILLSLSEEKYLSRQDLKMLLLERCSIRLIFSYQKIGALQLSALSKFLKRKMCSQKGKCALKFSNLLIVKKSMKSAIMRRKKNM